LQARFDPARRGLQISLFRSGKKEMQKRRDWGWAAHTHRLARKAAKEGSRGGGQ